ncbi:hypothetical protein VRRI112168_03415 [Vreelandella rituensis]|uniref:Transmembrane protein n=1 Tax=Vreelandella rituensis TaxID=2282306 RepID=A0A368UBH5_9GAMM|nr:hypothetical protein [Halomonas rituensis]RCV93702.1 hypothetical protein DU506_00685 [Halomonas rituensis]
MGFIRWTGRKLALPVSGRARVYKDIGTGLSSSFRLVNRIMPHKRESEPPLLPGSDGDFVAMIQDRWQSMNPEKRKLAWVEYKQAMPLIMKYESKQGGGAWSLSVPQQERQAVYAKAQKVLRQSLYLYMGLMSVPLAMSIFSWSNPIYWVNLTAATLILSPPLLRHLIVRAQVYHDGRVSPFQVFRRYPATLDAPPSGSSDLPQDSTDAIVSRGDFPTLRALYDIPDPGKGVA